MNENGNRKLVISTLYAHMLLRWLFTSVYEFFRTNTVLYVVFSSNQTTCFTDILLTYKIISSHKIQNKCSCITSTTHLLVWKHYANWLLNTFFYCTRALSLQKKYLEAIPHSGFPLMEGVFSISVLMTPWSVSITFCSMELWMTRTYTRKSKAWDTQRYSNIFLLNIYIV